ncbi:MAG: histidine phosphatase family protein [Hyphomonadaceae bacterium]
MRQLVLFRHAKAEPSLDERGDFDRALAPAGRNDAPKVAAEARSAGAAPQVVLVSAARRTRETWELAQRFFPDAEVRFLPELYLASEEALLAAAAAAGADNVMVIAHNPGLHDLACMLVQDGGEDVDRLHNKLPTAGLVCLERSDASTEWALRAFLTPKALRG